MGPLSQHCRRRASLLKLSSCAPLTQSFTSNNKLTDIMIEPNTLLVESTDSSLKDVCATLLCRTRRFFCRTQSHLFLLHRSPPWAPQHGGWLCHGTNSRSTPDLQWIFSWLSFAESSSLFQDRFPIKQGFWYWTCNLPAVFIWASFSDCPRSFWRRSSINFRLFMSTNTVCISGFIQILPNVLCMSSKVVLQVNQAKPCRAHVFTRIRSHLWIFLLNVHEFILVDSLRWMSSSMFMQVVTGCLLLSHETLHHLTKTFTSWHQLLHVVHCEGWISA